MYAARAVVGREPLAPLQPIPKAQASNRSADIQIRSFEDDEFIQDFTAAAGTAQYGALGKHACLD